MKLDAVLHRPMSEYCHGLDEEHIVYRIRCATDDINRIVLHYGDTACRVTPIIFTAVDMLPVARDKLHQYWEVTVKSPYERVYYYFELFDGEDSIYYYGDIFTRELVDDRSQYFKLPFNHRADIARAPDWVHEAVVYNIFPDSFASSCRHISGQAMELEFKGQRVSSRLGGTFAGIEQNSDYLAELGINCIYINPVFAAGEYHKYDLIDYFHTDPCFGGDEQFRSMVQSLHEKGIRVIIDGVFNHCGWYFFAFDDVVRNQEKSRYKEWFYRLKFPVRRPETPEEYPDYACFAYERMMPKLDTANPEVCEYLCSVGRYWVEEFDIDGWRLDVSSEVNDGFWRQFRKTVKSVKPDALLIGEVWETASHWLQGDMFDSAMNYDMRKHAELFFARGSIDALEFESRVTNMLMRYKKQLISSQLSILDSHDVSRFFSLCGEDKRRLKLAILFMLCFPGMPTLFYGDELGLKGVLEHEYRDAMPWQSGDKELYEFCRKAIKLRRSSKALCRGDFSVISAEQGSMLFAFRRRFENESISVYINAGDEPVACLPEENPVWAENIDSIGFAIYE